MNLTLQGCCKCFKRTIFAFQSGSNFWPKLFVHCWTSAPLLTFPLLMKELQIRTHTSLRLAAELKETALGFFFTAFSLYKPQICCWVTQPLPAFLWDRSGSQAGWSQAVQGLLGLGYTWHGARFTFGTCGWASTLLAKQTSPSSNSYRSHEQ